MRDFVRAPVSGEWPHRRISGQSPEMATGEMAWAATMVTQGAIAGWNAKLTGCRGIQPNDSELATETALSLRMQLHLPLRQAEAFLGSLFELMSLRPGSTRPAPVPIFGSAGAVE